MPYEPKNFEELLGTAGFSDNLLKNHFTLYQGYVANANKVADALAQMLHGGKAGTPEYCELKRRFGWEWDGMRMHEVYFWSMKKGGQAIDKKSRLAKMLMQEFGSLEEWEKDFRATGAMRGVGWAVLYFDIHQKRLFNMWINEHDSGHMAGGEPLLVMDVFEHAFITDYGLKRADYINAFMAAVDWGCVSQRYEACAGCECAECEK